MKKFLQKLALGVMSAVLCFGMFTALPASAADILSTNDLSPSNSGLKVPDKPATLIKNVINIVFVIAAVLTFAYLIWGAISWITSGGDKSKVESARNKITSAVIGLLILAATWALFSLVMQVAFGSEGITIKSLGTT